ncbi:MAG: HDIG domain-containing protein [Clostridia bacterium]|nr:HDIG domain-containing protein [Clostridia bacterium]
MYLPEYILNAIDILNHNGYKAYAVGGCVRDSIMELSPNDYDITTDAIPNEILRCFKDYQCLDFGMKHGTITVVLNENNIEITTFRIDGEYNDNRHPDEVIFTPLLCEDTKRRDFTMNSIAYSPNEGYVDHHNGITDIKKKIIRTVGDPSLRFNEDALRILRALRFSSTLGFKIEENTAKAIHKLKFLLNNIAAERIFVELTKLLCGKNVLYILEEFHDVFELIIPELSPTVGFEQNNIHHCYDVYKHTCVSVANIKAEPELRWAMLLHDTGKPHCYTEDERGGHFYGHYKISADIAKSALCRLKASNQFIQTVNTLVYHHDSVIPTTEKSVKRLIMKHGYPTTMKLFEINKADAMAQAKHQINERLERIDRLTEIAKEINERNECFSLSSMNINGNDLITAGIPKGKSVGKILNKLLLEVVDNKIPNEKSALLKRALVLKDIL